MPLLIKCEYCRKDITKDLEEANISINEVPIQGMVCDNCCEDKEDN